MSFFNYKVKNKQGKTVQGVIEAPSFEAAQEELQEKKFIILNLEEKVSELNVVDRTLGYFNRVSSKEIVFFSRQLSVMVSATVPLVRALRILVKQTESSYFKEVVADIATEVDGGKKLSQAVARYPRIFDHFFIHMIRSGETTGRLDEVLNYLADQKEKDYALNSRIISAMVYPVFIVFGLIVVGIVMMVKVVPQLTSVLIESGAEIPLATRILMGISEVAQHYWWLVIIIFALLAVMFTFYRRTKAGAWYIDLVKIKIPVFGTIFKKIYLARFSRGLANLLSAGVPITKALEIMAEVVSNQVYRDVIYRTSREVEVGNSVASVFIEDKNIPPMLSHMLIVGEETGRMDQVLKKTADFYSLEVETATASLVSLVEPVIMIILGAGVAFLVVSILMPMYSLTENI